MAIGLENLKSKKRVAITERSIPPERTSTTRPWEVADRFEEMSGQYKFRRTPTEIVRSEHEVKKDLIEFTPAQHQTEFVMNPLDLKRTTPGTVKGLAHLLSLAINRANLFSFFD